MAEKIIRLFALEDDPVNMGYIKGQLKPPHQMIGSSPTIGGVWEQISSMKEEGCNVVTLDGRLRDGEIDDDKGTALVRALRANLPEIKIIGLSGFRLMGRVDIDFDLCKDRVSNLLETALRITS